MKKILFIIITIAICACSVIGYLNYSDDKKVIKDILKEKIKRDNKLKCHMETDEANIEILYKFNKEGNVENKVKGKVFSTVSDTSEQYKKDVEEYFKDKYCKENSFNCYFNWDDKNVTMIYELDLIEEFAGVNISKLKEKIKEVYPDYKCK